MILDLKELSTPQLKAIRRILSEGTIAFSTKESESELNNLREYKRRQELINARRDEVAEVGYNIEDEVDYWLDFSDEAFHITIQKIKHHQNKAALSEKIAHLQVPQIILPKLDSMEILRAGFAELKEARKN